MNNVFKLWALFCFAFGGVVWCPSAFLYFAGRSIYLPDPLSLDERLSLNERLFVAAKAGNATEISSLLGRGATVFAENRDEMTALHYAALGGHKEVVRILCQQTAEMDKRSGDVCGETRFRMLNRQNRYGLTALHIAASHGHLEVVVLLCQQCAHGNALDCLGDTPLHKAALKGHLDVVKFLCENGVMVHSRNKNGKLPIDYARQNGHQSVVRFLESVDTRFEPRQDFSLLDQTKSFYFDD